MLAEEERAEESGLVALADTVKVPKTQQKKGGKTAFKSNVFDDHVPSDVTDLEIMSINSQNLPWKANSCMLSQNHPARDAKKCEQQALHLSQTGSSS